MEQLCRLDPLQADGETGGRRGPGRRFVIVRLSAAYRYGRVSTTFYCVRNFRFLFRLVPATATLGSIGIGVARGLCNG